MTLTECDVWSVCPRDMELTGALDPRCLEQLMGQRLYEVAQEQRAEAGLKGHVKENEAEMRVEHPEPDLEVAHRDHQDLKRDEIAANENGEYKQIAAERKLGQGKAGQ